MKLLGCFTSVSHSTITTEACGLYAIGFKLDNKTEPSPIHLISSSVFVKDSPGWDGGRSNGFINGYHDARINGTANFGRGLPRNDRGGRGGYRGNRNGGSFNQPMHNAGEIIVSSCTVS